MRRRCRPWRWTCGPPRRPAMATRVTGRVRLVTRAPWFATGTTAGCPSATRSTLLRHPVKPCRPAAATCDSAAEPQPRVPCPAIGPSRPVHLVARALSDVLELPRMTSRRQPHCFVGRTAPDVGRWWHTVTAFAEALAASRASIVGHGERNRCELATALAALRSGRTGTATVRCPAWPSGARVPARLGCPPGHSRTRPVAWTVDARQIICATRCRLVATSRAGWSSCSQPNAGPDRVADILRTRSHRPRRFRCCTLASVSRRRPRSVSGRGARLCGTVLCLPLDATVFDLSHIAASGYQELRLTPTGAMLRAETSATPAGWAPAAPASR